MPSGGGSISESKVTRKSTTTEPGDVLNKVFSMCD